MRMRVPKNTKIGSSNSSNAIHDRVDNIIEPTTAVVKYSFARLAAIGAVISSMVMFSHFWSKKNSLFLLKPTKIVDELKEITISGFSAFFIDVAMGILTVLFNRQINKIVPVLVNCCLHRKTPKSVLQIAAMQSMTELTVFHFCAGGTVWIC